MTARHSVSVTNWLRQMRYPPTGVVPENYSLYPRVTLLPNRPCFPINTKHFRRSSVAAEKKFERLSYLIGAPTSSCPRESEGTVENRDTWNLPSPDGGLFRFRSSSHRAAPRRDLACVLNLSISACHYRRGSEQWLLRGTGNVTSNSVCHPAPHANREFLFRFDIPVHSLLTGFDSSRVAVALFHPPTTVTSHFDQARI